jgi:hypothetical protein
VLGVVSLSPFTQLELANGTTLLFQTNDYTTFNLLSQLAN